MRLRIFFFDTDRQEYHGQWMDSAEKVMAPVRYTLMVDGVIIPLSGDTDKALCNRVWRFSQNDAHRNGWIAAHDGRTTERARSMSAGDIIEIEGVGYRVANFGFERVPEWETFAAHFGALV